jgi:hypothetical protein
MTILQEGHHSFLIVEHDPLLYTPALDPHLQKMTELADRGGSASAVSRREAGQRPSRRSWEDLWHFITLTPIEWGIQNININPPASSLNNKII